MFRIQFNLQKSALNVCKIRIPIYKYQPNSQNGGLNIDMCLIRTIQFAYIPKTSRKYEKLNNSENKCVSVTILLNYEVSLSLFSFWKIFCRGAAGIIHDTTDGVTSNSLGRKLCEACCGDCVVCYFLPNACFASKLCW